MIFVDTSAFYAVLDRDDEHHPKARDTWRKIVDVGEGLLTSNYVVVETSALIQHRLGLQAVRSFADDLLPIVALEWVTREDHSAALSALLLAGRRDLSLVDCASFQLMRRLGLRQAFAFDRDFPEQGFRTT